MSTQPALLPAADAPATVESSTSLARLHHARLVLADGTRYAALIDSGAKWVIPAAGCLLRPALGDQVLISLSGDQGYILSVLERATPDAPADISVSGDMRLNVPDGRLTLRAARGIGLDAGPALDVAADELSAALQHATVACRTLHMTGDTAHTQWTTRTTVAGHALEVATRHESHVQDSVRHVTGHEDFAAQSLRQTIDQDWSVSADTVDLKARDRVSVQSDSVQLG